MSFEIEVSKDIRCPFRFVGLGGSVYCRKAKNECNDDSCPGHGTYVCIKKELATVEAVTKAFHDSYERLAKEFGYVTREDTRVFDPVSPNGKLMLATVRAVLRSMGVKVDR